MAIKGCARRKQKLAKMAKDKVERRAEKLNQARARNEAVGKYSPALINALGRA